MGYISGLCEVRDVPRFIGEVKRTDSGLDHIMLNDDPAFRHFTHPLLSFFAGTGKVKP
jgi:hypothetical protein